MRKLKFNHMSWLSGYISLKKIKGRLYGKTKQQPMPEFV